MLHIDGSYGEGGGQVVRTALALAAITGTGVTLTRIRHGRATPGLQPQHLAAVQLAADLCAARVEGAAPGSVSLRFQPQAPVSAGRYTRDIGTAGSTALVLQTALLPLTRAATPSQVRLTGGTHVAHAPSLDYLEAVYLPALGRTGLRDCFKSPRHRLAGLFRVWLCWRACHVWPHTLSALRLARHERSSAIRQR